MENLVEDSELWMYFWQKISKIGNGINCRDELISRYSENHRAYHTTQHLNECLVLFKQQQYFSQEPEDIFFAIWYHDAIYDTSSHKNEEESANLAQIHFSTNEVNHEKAKNIADLILATKHSIDPLNIDQRLLVDIDLAILGTDEARFLEYEQQIRTEYSFVPDLIFEKKRTEILKNFLSRPKIYNTPYFLENFENLARLNLMKAIA
jgi:predicted metal-dependent HD superfamily phosphohydrolase